MGSSCRALERVMSCEPAEISYALAIMTDMLVVFIPVAAVIAIVLFAEYVHWHASKSGPRLTSSVSSCAVIVLGFPTRRNGTLHPIQRWRTRIGIRSLGSMKNGIIIFTGGTTYAGKTEAQVMADYALRWHVPAEQIKFETTSRNTRENISYSFPIAEPYRYIALASDPLHAARARQHARAQHPEMSDVIIFADNYRFLEQWWLKVPTAVFELYLILFKS